METKFEFYDPIECFFKSILNHVYAICSFIFDQFFSSSATKFITSFFLIELLFKTLVHDHLFLKLAFSIGQNVIVAKFSSISKLNTKKMFGNGNCFSYTNSCMFI